MTDNVTSFAYAGRPAWHGKGNQLTEGANLDQWIKEAGFDWQALRAPLMYVPGDGIAREIKDRYTYYRSDTNDPVGIISDHHKPVQPRQVMEFFRDLTEGCGMKMETAGVLRGGSRFFALAATGNSKKIANDRHDAYVLLSTSLDRTLATTAMPTVIRVECENMLRMALGSAGVKFSVKHNADFDPDKAKEELGLLNIEAGLEDMRQRLEALAEVRVSDDEAKQLFAEVLTGKHQDRRSLGAGSLDELLATPVGAPVQRERERAINGLSKMVESYYQAPGRCPGTAYGVLQGVTHFYDSKKTDSALFGNGAAKKQAAFDLLLERYVGQEAETAN